MTLARFRQWKESKARIPWDEIEATVIEVAALEQILKDEPEALMKRAMRAELALADLDTRVRGVLLDLDGAEDLKAAVEAAIRDLREALQRVVKLAPMKEGR
jgi:hypothetical protein